MNHERAIRRQRQRRRFRVRKRLRGTAERPRLTVFRSNKHIYAQLVDDLAGKTLVSAGSTEKEIGKSIASGGNKDAAALIGKTIAERAKAAGLTNVMFDRGHCKYHGRVAALAEAAREGGLSF
ncbi:MAG: 50S ribosomal protein L18 [Planctomycetota bacterium]|nr:MAG: 50S ribosomal protein L18 [Planctomycetota bacterium]REJ97164.1 MAG: 50S ribosomal protein L18 [Planctomycetota bacterium]REK27973.1 MAG: 50S ribosomal protein L18 [Planctomycetota bacterium]REK48709.1 MAG: 50S ribosomal protein L18 [Planctomycetota bacterium]